MLTEKDYCDFETCVALKELGFSSVNECFQTKIVSKEIPLKFFDMTHQGTSLEYAPIISLYEAQKWLREEKDIIVCPGKNSFGWYYVIHYNVGKVQQFKYSEEYDTYEESLSEGIKEAIKHIEII